MIFRQIVLAILLIISPRVSFANDYYLATSDLNVRSGEGTEYSVSYALKKGDEVELLSKNRGWCKIRFWGEVGYVQEKYLEFVPGATNSFEQSNSGIFGYGLSIILGLIIVGWLLPILIIVSSGKVTAGEKLAWVLAVLFISWFAWIIYLLVAPIKKRE